jgi:hypothetical protein
MVCMSRNRLGQFARSALGAMLLAACAVAQAAPYVMYRDPGCGCCEEWLDHVREELGYEVTVREREAAGVSTAAGMPREMTSCHTLEIEGYAIEGHVPAREIARLLRERPEGVEGLAVPGMPIGSPGMEMGDRVQPYQVIAFGKAGTQVYASYP